MAEHHRHPGDLVGGLVVGEDAVRDQLVALDALDEHLDAHLVVEVIRQLVDGLRGRGQHRTCLRGRQGGIEVHPGRPGRHLHPRMVGDLGLGQGHAVARRQGDARSAQRVRQHRDRVIHARPGEIEALSALGRDRRFLLLVSRRRAVRPGCWRGRGHELVQPSLQGIERGLPRTGEVGRHAIDDPGDGRGVEWSSREPVADLACVEQRGEQQRLVHRVARPGGQRAGRAAKDARVRLVPDLVGHVPEHPVGVVLHLPGEVGDRIDWSAADPAGAAVRLACPMLPCRAR